MTETYGGRTFDRVARVDPRSFDHLVATIYVSAEDRVLQAEFDALAKRMTAAEAAITSLAPPVPVPSPTPPPAAAATVWPCGAVLDQGQYGMCVGYAWAGWAMTGPAPKVIVAGIGGDDEGSTADLLYDQAQKDDGSAPDPQSGASTTGGASASVQLGYAKSYAWALNVGQLVVGIQKQGPGVVGVPWRSTMMDPDSHGVLDCGDKSKDVGGHEFVVPRHYPAGAPGNPSAVEAMLGMRQSWGPAWGLAGDAFIPVSGFADLLADGGDATIPVKA